MKLNLKQTKLVGLTMELELKTMEYKDLCKELDEVKESGIDPNDSSLLKLLFKFKKNNEEISEINKQLKELEDKE